MRASKHEAGEDVSNIVGCSALLAFLASRCRWLTKPCRVVGTPCRWGKDPNTLGAQMQVLRTSPSWQKQPNISMLICIYNITTMMRAHIHQSVYWKVYKYLGTLQPLAKVDVCVKGAWARSNRLSRRRPCSTGSSITICRMNQEHRYNIRNLRNNTVTET